MYLSWRLPPGLRTLGHGSTKCCRFRRERRAADTPDRGQIGSRIGSRPLNTAASRAQPAISICYPAALTWGPRVADAGTLPLSPPRGAVVDVVGLPANICLDVSWRSADRLLLPVLGRGAGVPY
ncbi:hypothetical protein NDU88_001415 [Pleurodeles waltl]|uniref:Uncharacterized protein n=1 Tax=Pleurodeles waltl TaxID=8319 RepID=A0AAV7U6F0_PLEWA|nr:hypothetical protein NDU88_001415 [Pleurodeles waltl]